MEAKRRPPRQAADEGAAVDALDLVDIRIASHLQIIGTVTGAHLQEDMRRVRNIGRTE